MTHIKLAMVFLLFLLSCCICWGDTDAKFSVEFVKHLTLTHSGINARKNADVLIYSLTKINENNTIMVVDLMEYMLDAIVCESWAKIDKLDDRQHKRTMNVLYTIREYREQNPKVEGAQVDLEQVSDLFLKFDVTYEERAKKILSELPPESRF